MLNKAARSTEQCLWLLLVCLAVAAADLGNCYVLRQLLTCCAIRGKQLLLPAAAALALLLLLLLCLHT
jgi:hypothetical protein